jgi:ADP-ribosylglycohydrolase
MPRHRELDEREDRELACLLGGALGDAMGYRVEFSSRARILREHGPQGIRLDDCRGRLVASDDTQMALFTLEGMERALAAADGAAPDDGALLESIRQAYLDWLQTQDAGARVPVGMLARHPEMNAARAPGMTCLDALRRGGRGSPGQPINDSKGCGGVMRTAPIGFLDARFSDAQVFDLGLRAGALTHGHPDGWLPSGAMALLVRLLASGADWQAAAREAIGHVAGAAPQGSDTEALLRKAVQLAATQPGSVDALVELGQDWVGEEALAIGLYAAMSTDRFEDCLALAANHDGDSDSTASIAGQLFGACHGLLALPVEPVHRIDVLEPLLDMAARWQALHVDGAQGAPGRTRTEAGKTPTHSKGEF